MHEQVPMATFSWLRRRIFPIGGVRVVMVGDLTRGDRRAALTRNLWLNRLIYRSPLREGQHHRERGRSALQVLEIGARQAKR